MVEAFQVVCVAKAQTNWGHHHIVGVGTAPKPGAPDRWLVPAVLARLDDGDLFYTTNSFGDPIFVRGHRCWCGTDTVRTTHDDDSEDPLDRLPACPWEAEASSGGSGDLAGAAPGPA
ncbi:MAG TPA: hypothetical protein VMB72_14695 [Acidimicrobiales bacterium]|nr:hypothetical protein [Acidimicrobiales bacterium]